MSSGGLSFFLNYNFVILLHNQSLLNLGTYLGINLGTIFNNLLTNGTIVTLNVNNVETLYTEVNKFKHILTSTL